MIDEKNPRQNSDNDDSSDDEVIIDLTEEIEIEPKEDYSVLKFTEKRNVDDPLFLEVDGASEAENDEKFIAFDDVDDSKSAEDDADRDLPDRIADAQEGPAEDQLIASAMEYSLGTDEDEDREITEKFDLSADKDDDILTMDVARDEAEETSSISDGGKIAEDQKDEGLFDLKKDIDLESGLDDDEEDIIDLKDKYQEEEEYQKFNDLLLVNSNVSDQAGDSRETTEFLEFEPEKPDNMLIDDADQKENTEVIALTEEDVDNDVLSDLKAISRLDFEDEEDTDESPAIDEYGFDSSDDIIARAIEEPVGLDDDRDRIDLAQEADSAPEDQDAIPDRNELQEDDEESMVLSEEKSLEFEGNDGLLDLNEAADLKDDFEASPLDGFNGVEAEDDHEIIEITEFDQHFPADGEALLKQSGMFDRKAEDEDEFIELIDVDEDSVPEDEKIIEFSDSPLNRGGAELDQFFKVDLADDDPLIQASKTNFRDDKEDKFLENDVSKPIIDDPPESEFGFNDEIQETAEELDEMESEPIPKAETVFSEDEEFEISLDPGAIAKQADRVDTFLFKDSPGEPVVASLDADRAEEKKIGPEDSQAGTKIDGPLALSPGQIDAAIERIINDKFSGKIEEILYEVIEKVVAKEINQLKNSLLGKKSIDDDQI